MPIEVTPLEITMFIKFVQLRNALFPIVVTLLGIATIVNPHPSNALSPIEVTLLGIVILVKLVQPENVLLAIEVMLLEIVMLVKLEQP